MITDDHQTSNREPRGKASGVSLLRGLAGLQAHWHLPLGERASRVSSLGL